jgi:chemotaxis protein MotB
VSANSKWVEIKIPTRMLFPSGSQALLSDAVPMLRALAETLREIPNELVVQGHSDNRPIRNGRFPSNWELSSARAAAVARVFEEEGIDPARLSAVGFSSSRPVADNDSEEGRTENRRVVVLFRQSLEQALASGG